MKRKHLFLIALPVIILVSLDVVLLAQGTPADYERAANLSKKLEPLALNIVDQSGWIEKTPRLWYRKSVKGGFEFEIADAAAATKSIAFDHEKLAAALALVIEDKVDPNNLPFRTIEFKDDGKSVEFNVNGTRYSCDLTTYTCTKSQGQRRRRIYHVGKRSGASGRF
jgi:hypothetical protein